VRAYSFHPEAFADLDEVWEYIAQDSITAANRVIDNIESALNMLASNPYAGHLRPDLNSNALRFWVVGSYLILIPQRTHFS